MAKPTDEELKIALEAATQIREQDKDNLHIAKALLNCHYQNSYLLAVLHAAEDYLRSGLAEREHTQLVRAIEKAREIDDYSAHREHNSLGL